MPLQITTTIKPIHDNVRFVQDTLIVLGYHYSDLFYWIKEEYFSFIIGVHPEFAEIDLQNYQSEINRRIDSERTLVTGVLYMEAIPKSTSIVSLEYVLRNKLSENMRAGIFTLDLFDKVVALQSSNIKMRAKENKKNILKTIQHTEHEIAAGEDKLAQIIIELQKYPASIETPLSPVSRSAMAYAFYQPRFKPSHELTESETAEVLHHHERFSIDLKKERNNRADLIRHHPRKKTAAIQALNLSDSTSASSDATPLFPDVKLPDRTSPQLMASKKFNMTKSKMVFHEYVKRSLHHRNKKHLIDQQFYISQQVENLKVFLGRQKKYFSITLVQNVRIAYERILHEFYDFVFEVRVGRVLAQDWKKYFLQLHSGELPGVQISQSPQGKSAGVIVEVSRVVKDLNSIPERIEEIMHDIALVHDAIAKDFDGPGLPACFSSEVEILLSPGDIINASFYIKFSSFKLTPENRDIFFGYIHEKLFDVSLSRDYSLAGITSLEDNLDCKPEGDTELRRMRPSN
jgi:hypothetical protein